jgi:hypothetical protein
MRSFERPWTQRLLTQLCAIVLLAIFASSCGKSDAPETATTRRDSTTTNPALDTTQAAKEVTPDSAHLIYYQPKIGEIRKYRIMTTSSGSIDVNDQLLGSPSTKQQANSRAEFVIRQEIKGKSMVKNDSVTDVSFFIEKADVTQVQDTSRINYSSSNAAQRNDPMFDHFTGIIGKEIKAKVTRTGDPVSITGAEAIATELMKKLPDSLRNNQYIKQQRIQQLNGLISQSVVRLLVFLPKRPVGKDSSWSETAEQNVPMPLQIMFPMTQTSKEVVRGFEERMGRVVAVLEATSTIKPKKNVIEQGDAKATISNFKADVRGVTRVEDQTGLVIHRTLNNARQTDFTIETKQQPGKIYKMSSRTEENLVVELLP